MIKDEYIIECSNIVKTFSGVTVLDNAELHIKKGEIHALMGENGAGKSTIIKIITGVHSMDSGEILYDGKPVKIRNRADAQKLGISTVFQELSLIPALSVAENIMLGREHTNRFGLLDKKSCAREVQKIINRYGFHVRATDLVETLSIAQRQTVEILKGLAMDASLLILDEPTASLTATESKHLFEIIHALTEKGVSILYISHRLEEVYAHADAITVLRDGKYVGRYEKKDVTPQQIVKAMINKDISNMDLFAKPSCNEGKTPLLSVRDLCVKDSIQHVSFDLYPGEVLGLSGLVGSGRTEVLHAIFGSDPTASGDITVEGKPYRRGSIQAAIGMGIGLVPEDRALEGYVPLSSIRENMVSANFDWINRAKLFVDNAREKLVADEAIQKLKVKPADPNAHMLNLSGGNQQKVVLGKWLSRELKILLVDEPTAGVDVGAKDEIYALIQNLQASGAAVLLVSSDLTELLKLSNRILVLRNGGVIRELLGGEADEERLLTIASGMEEEKQA